MIPNLLLLVVLSDGLNTGGIEVGYLDNLDLAIELLELGNDSLLELLGIDADVGDRRPHTWSSEGGDVWSRWRLQVLADDSQVLGRQKTRSMMEGALAGDLVGGSGDLEWLILEKR